jgi:hypothetical protein
MTGVETEVDASAWSPIVDGELAREARAAVREIAIAVSSAPVHLPGEISPAAATAWRASLGSGCSGQSLLYGYLALARENGLPFDPADFAVELLDRASEAVASVPMTESLYSGFPGVAWATQHLAGKAFEEMDDSLDPIDEALLASLSRSAWTGELDLINGLAGLGIYALERLPRPAARQCLERIIDHLAELAERRDGHATWFSPPERLPDYQRAVFPQGLYNLGASHGIAGILAVLAAACGAGVAESVAGPLVEQAVAWLLARRQEPAIGSAFDTFYHPASPPRRSRLAWCYGDAGIAATLLAAARAMGRADWEREAVAVALRSADRPRTTCGVEDAGLCHGAAGLAHLFNRMFQRTGEERLGAAAREWVGQTLAARQPGRGVGGFRSWSSDLSGKKDWRDDPGLLEGAAGIGLALLAATSAVEPAWDRLLLVAT